MCVCLLWSERGGRVFLGTHTTRIGRERVRVHPSQRERGIFGDTSLCTRHLRERHHHRIAERYNTSKPYRVDDRALREEEEDQEELYHQTFLRPALRRLYSLLLFDAQQTRRRTPSSGAGKCRRKKRSSASDDEDAVVVGETALGHRGRGKETARHGTQTRKR